MADRQKVWDLEICKDIDLLKQAGTIILYGAGVRGKDVLSRLRDAEINVHCFCDMDMAKWGKLAEGVEIISPFELNSVESNARLPVYIIACILQNDELMSLLAHIGLKETRVVTYWGIKTALGINAERIYEGKSRRLTFCRIEKEQIRRRIFDHRLHIIHYFMTAARNAVWVLQPGKTASTSLEARLEKCRLPFIKMHSLEYTNHILGEDYREAWEEWVRERKSEPLKVIVAIREPLARDYSAFWQVFTEGNEKMMLIPVLHKDFQEAYNSYTDLLLKGSAYRNDVLGELSPITWNDEFEWLDEHVKNPLGIDVFAYPFDRERGYTIIKKDNIELLLFKVEKLESLLDEIGAFVGVGKLPTINANTADKKWYGPAYSQFKREVKLPQEYVKHYYHDNPKMDYFYTAEEKAAFLDKWSRNIDDNILSELKSDI